MHFSENMFLVCHLSAHYYNVMFFFPCFKRPLTTVTTSLPVKVSKQVYVDDLEHRRSLITNRRTRYFLFLSCGCAELFVQCLFRPVWFKVKLHAKDAKTFQDKKKYVAFWLERYAKREPGMPLTVVFDMTESGISNIVSPPLAITSPVSPIVAARLSIDTSQ